jgi:MoxR-like ATPase
MAKWHQAPDVLAAAARWKDRCLLRDGSILADGKRLWTIENLDGMDRYFVRNLNYKKGDFYGKLEGQLGPASAQVKQLAAEMLWLLFIFVAKKGMGGATKRLQIQEVWEWSGEPVPASRELGAVLDAGIGATGPGYNNHRWRELVFLVDAVRAWKRLSAGEHRTLTSDPWAFASWLDAVPSSKNRQLREILLYLLFPEHFERMATGRDKKHVIAAFLKKESKDPATFDYRDRIRMDRELMRIREAWAPTLGGSEFDYYRGAARQEWDRGAKKPPRGGKGKKTRGGGKGPPVDTKSPFGLNQSWIIAAGSGGRWWPDFEKEGLIATATDDLGDLSQYESRAAIHEAIVAIRGSEHDPTNDSLAAWAFAHEVKVGDNVFAKSGLNTLLGHGVVTSEYEFDDERAEASHVRRVEWKKTGRWILPEGHQAPVKALTAIQPHEEWLEVVWDLIYGEEGEPAAEELGTPYTVEDAMMDLFMPRDSFNQIVDALAAKKNVVLEGAPGVGKTFVARRLAWAFMRVRDNSRVEVVQFHQSYAYEDFVQGWRPDGKGFERRNGAFYRFCERARKQPDKAFVFVVDEINRGNISKILGELLMLIEADKRGAEHAVQLAYSNDEERFWVPENVYLIGLMNTADRSLAMVDFALRRRFAFFRLTPAFETEAFAEFLDKRGVPEGVIGRIRRAMSALNKEIASDRAALGPGYEIGHSFFVPPEGADVLDESWYSSVIAGEIEPLLREYWFDQPERVDAIVKSMLA